MRILLINHYAGSPEMGMEYRPYYLAKEWGKLGHEVTVAAADCSHLRRKNPEGTQPVWEQEVEGVRYVFLQTPSYTENDRRRYRNIFTFLRLLWKHGEELAERYRPDLVIASSTYPMDMYPAKRIAAKAGAKLVYEIHDIHPDSYEQLYDYSPSHPMMLALRQAVKYAYRNADKVISILPRADRHMKALGFPTDQFFYIPNGILPEQPPARLPQRHIDLITRYSRKGYFIVMYLGGFAPANALEPLVEAARHSPRGVLYMLVGDGVEKAALRRYTRRSNLNNVMYLDPVEKDQVQSVLSLADCLYLGARPLPVYQYGVGMNKLFDYLYAARPIVCAMDVPENPVSRAGCGVVVPKQDPKQIAQAVERIRALSPMEREAMGRRGRDYVMAHHQYPALARRFLAVCGQEQAQTEASPSFSPEKNGDTEWSKKLSEGRS